MEVPVHIEETHAHEEIHAHKLVLFSSSEYFKALVRWEVDDAGVERTGSNKRFRGSKQHAIITLPSKAQFSTARKMMRFLYTQQLEEGIERAEVLLLLQLADKYSLRNLRCACMQQLDTAPVKDWAAAEKQLLCSIASMVVSDTNAGGDLAAAAEALIRSLADSFTQLEVVWRDQEVRAAFCSLPHAVVTKVLSSDDLVVRSENTVLVTALSWLRTGGKEATAAERRQVLRNVRVLQLSPWFFSWLVRMVPEAPELMPAEALTKAVLHLGCPTAHQQALQAEDTLLRAWSTPRAGADPGIQVELATAWAQDAVLETVARCHGDGELVQQVSAYVYYNGFMWRAQLGIKRQASSADTVWVRADVHARLEVGGAVLEPAPGMLRWPANLRLSVGDRHRKVAICRPEACVLGGGYGFCLAELKPEDAALERLKRSFKEGKLSLQVTLMG